MTAYIPQAKREDWRTPSDVVALVRDLYHGEITLDPCSSHVPDYALATRNLCGPEFGGVDGLKEVWTGRVYVNPPFGDLRAWVKKCADEAGGGIEIVLLMPARTDTIAWHEHVKSASAVCLWRGRMTFQGAPAPAPFPVALVYWGHQINRSREIFAPHGMVFRP